MVSPSEPPALNRQASRLLSLADELLLNIIEQIGHVETLRNFTLTCTKAQHLTEPHLYRYLHFRRGDTVHRFWDAIEGKPYRGSYVQHLDVRYKIGSGLGMELLANISGVLPHLRTWSLEYSCPNDNLAYGMTGDFGPGPYFWNYWDEVPKLHYLQSIHIHIHPRGPTSKNYFDLFDGKGAVIFKSQSLRHVFLSCADITTNSVQLLENCTEQTPLETLIFEECNITSTALGMILSQPKALKRLTLGERLHHFHVPPSAYLPESGSGLAQALSLQASSLTHIKQTQQLSHVLLHWSGLTASERSRTFASPSELPDFPCLTELDVPYGSPLQSIAAKLPPQLEKIRVHHFHDHIPDAALEAITRELRLFQKNSLKQLEIVLIEIRTGRDQSRSQWLEEILGSGSTRSIFFYERKRAEIWDFGRRLQMNNIRLTVNWCQ